MDTIRDPQGAIYTDPGGTPVSWNSGMGFNAAGALCTSTSPGANDSYQGGKRLDPVGRLVVGNGDPPARPYNFNAGLPFDKRDGSLIRQMNQTPASTDPFVAGVRVGPLGGVYMLSANPPLPANTVAPVVTGIPQSGNYLDCSTGTWTDVTAISFQWQKDSLNIIGQTGSRLSINSTYIGSVVRCIVTGHNDVGSVDAISNSVTIS